MDKLSKDVLFNIATMLDLDELLSFCSSDSRINRLVCQGEAIWNFKLMKEFPDYKSHIKQRGKEAYELLVSLTRLKEGIKYEGSIYELYKKTELDLTNKGLTALPPEIANLTQLGYLSLSNNQITTLPPEIEKLINLHYLYLNNNKIEILPPEIGKLKNLRMLLLNGNKINLLPSEINDLTNLRTLYIDKNVLISGLKIPNIIFM